MSRKSSRKPLTNSSDLKPIHLAISGTPGTGKTTLAKRIAKLLKIEYISLIDIITSEKLFDKYDSKDKTYDVYVPRVEKYLRANLKSRQSYVLDTHLAHALSKNLVDTILVTTCNIAQLNKRLKMRKYSKTKIRENLDAEIFQYCFTEAIDSNKIVEKIDCTIKLSENNIKEHLRRLHLLH